MEPGTDNALTLAGAPREVWTLPVRKTGTAIRLRYRVRFANLLRHFRTDCRLERPSAHHGHIENCAPAETGRTYSKLELTTALMNNLPAAKLRG